MARKLLHDTLSTKAKICSIRDLRICNGMGGILAL